MRRISDADLNSSEDELVHHRMNDDDDRSIVAMCPRDIWSPSADEIRARHRHGARRGIFVESISTRKICHYRSRTLILLI